MDLGRGHERPLDTLALDVHDLAAVVADVGLDRLYDELIDSLEAAVSGFDRAFVVDKVRAGFSYEDPGLGLVEWMPTMRRGETIAVKMVGYHPSNPVERNLPSVLATTSLYDTRSGHLHTICEATFLTALRTGAASAMVSDVLATPGPIRLGLVGAGAQAVTQLHAISRVRPVVDVVVTDAEPSVADSLARRLPQFASRISVVSSERFSNEIAELDVLCTCTSVEPGAGPVVTLTETQPWLHVNAVGSDFPGKTEIPLDFLNSAVVVPDVVDQCLVEGEAQQLEPADLGPSLVELMSNPAPGELVGQRTVFDSTGWAFEDLVAAELFVGHARRLGLGKPVRLHHRTVDPYDPYEMTRLSIPEADE